jgi:hypothetical protein
MRRRTETTKIPIGMPASEGVVLTVLTYLKNGKIDDAIARFAEEFRFKDHGMGVELKDRERLREFFLKTWKFYPDSFWQTDTIFACGDHVITEWTSTLRGRRLRTADSHEGIESRCTGRPSCAQAAARLSIGRTTMTD